MKSTHQDAVISTLRAQDAERHGRLQGYVNFPVQGSAGPYTSGLYYTRVELGTPPREYYMQIDTLSNATLIDCKATTSNATRIHRSYYDRNDSVSQHGALPSKKLLSKNLLMLEVRAAVLGDIFLKNKVITYDLDAQVIGWADKSDCDPSSLNISRTSHAPKLPPKRAGTRRLKGDALYRLLVLLPITLYFFHS